MKLYLTIAGVGVASLVSLLFSSLTYSLREFSRQRLAEYLGKRDADKWFETVTEHSSELAFLTAVVRQICNVTIWVFTFAAFEQTSLNPLLRYGLTIIVAVVIAIFCSIALPHAGARYAAAELVGFFSPMLAGLYWVFSPVAKLMYRTDEVVRRALGAENAAPAHDIEEDILSAVEEGEKEGVVNEQEREMIESVMEFAGATVAQIMTPRQEVAALSANATLSNVKDIIQSSGHSRIPVFDGTLDHVVGILHARDLIKQIGSTDIAFDLRQTMRPAIFVPETKPLRDLLSDFRVQKVHIAVVLDEYGSTAGVVTIEDILEELVGEISDEHEPAEPAMFKKIDEKSAEADAKITIEQINRLLALNIPDDAGYDTLGGFLTTSLSRIPEKGATYEHDGARYTVMDAEPQRVKRVKIEFIPQPSQAKSA